MVTRRASARSVRRQIATRVHFRPHCSARCRENHWMVGALDAGKTIGWLEVWIALAPHLRVVANARKTI